MTTNAVRMRQAGGRSVWERLYPAAFSLLLAVIIVGLLLLVSGRDPIAAYQSLLYGAFGTKDRFTETLVKATPFLILAISVSVSFRCQVWNIGAEGQFLVGAILSAWTALTFEALPAYLLLPLTLIAGVIGGAIWSGIAGVLKAYLEANEVITTSMLNYIAIYLLAYLVRGPMIDPEGFNFPQSRLIQASVRLPRLMAGTRLNAAFIGALVLVVGAFFFWRSTLGLRTEIVGASRRVAAYAGLDVKRTIVWVSLISGGLAGIAGWGDILGVHYRLIEEIARGMGSLAIVIALLGELHPLGMIASAFLFAALVVGGNAMERNAGVPFALVDVIQGIVILLVLARAHLFRSKSS